MLLGIIGVAVIAYGLYQLWRGAQKNLRKHLRLGGADQDVARWAIGVARFGIMARGVVLLIIGWSFVRGATHQDAAEVGGLGASLTMLGSGPQGTVLLGTVAVGLVGYGIWQLVNARYREMELTRGG